MLFRCPVRLITFPPVITNLLASCAPCSSHPTLRTFQALLHSVLPAATCIPVSYRSCATTSTLPDRDSAGSAQLPQYQRSINHFFHNYFLLQCPHLGPHSTWHNTLLSVGGMFFQIILNSSVFQLEQTLALRAKIIGGTMRSCWHTQS